MKNIYILCAAITLVAALEGHVFADDITGKWAAGYRYSYIRPDDADFRKRGGANGLDLTHGLNKYLALELEGDYYTLKSMAHTRLGVGSLFTNLQLRKDIGNIVPYLVGGLGVQHFNYTALGPGDRKDYTFSYAYKSGAGIEYFINPHVSLNTEASYVYGNTGSNASLDVFGWRFSGGVKYYF